MTKASQKDSLLQADTHIVHPGELKFAIAPFKLRTVLGSCIAITVWHPELKVGGICHYLVPKMATAKMVNSVNFRYAEDATTQLYKLMNEQAPVTEFNVCIWGGSQMFATEEKESIGSMNQAHAEQWVRLHKLHLKHQDVGGNVGRTLIFDLHDGCCYLKKYTPSEGSIYHGH